KASAGTSRPPVCSRTAAKARSNSDSLPTVIRLNCRPTLRTACCVSRILSSVFGFFGFARKKIVSIGGTSSHSHSSCFGNSVAAKTLTLVALPPGWLRVAIRIRQKEDRLDWGNELAQPFQLLRQQRGG